MQDRNILSSHSKAIRRGNDATKLSPVTGPYHGPALSDQLRLIGSLAGTTDKRGHQDQRETVAYVEQVTSDMLDALKVAEIQIAKTQKAQHWNGYTMIETDDALKAIRAAIAKAEGNA